MERSLICNDCGFYCKDTCTFHSDSPVKLTDVACEDFIECTGKKRYRDNFRNLYEFCEEDRKFHGITNPDIVLGVEYRFGLHPVS